MDSVAPYFIVLIFSTAQSIIGVGLLLFGTPSLILLGYQFDEALLLLLPSSIMISLLQVLSDTRQIHIDRRIYYITLPALIVGLSIVINNNEIEIGKIIGSMMLMIAVLRISPILEPKIRQLLCNHATTTYFIIGVIHGISNMGGGLLSLFTSSIHKGKHSIRINTAFAYLIFGVTQLAVILWFKQNDSWLDTLTLPVLAISIYLVVERTIFGKIDDNLFQKIITLLVIIYSATLLY